MPNFGKIRPAIVERSKSCAVMGVHNRSYNNRLNTRLFEGAKHGPTGMEGSINRQIYGDLRTPYCVVTFTWKYISHHKVHLHRQIYGDLRTLYCAVTFTLMYNSHWKVIVRITCSRECHCTIWSSEISIYLFVYSRLCGEIYTSKWMSLCNMEF